jgi:hypothetical protein
MRWGWKPPPDTRCDSHVMTEANEIDRCPGIAVETVITTLGLEAWMCAGCVTALEAKGTIRRNPKRRP